MSNLRTEVLLPTGRIVQGDVYEAKTTDADNKALTIKTGPNAGQATQQYFIAVAIPKTPGVTHWAQETWGAEFWRVGNLAFPKIAEGDSFSWKVTNGDSAKPNKKGIVPNTREGFPGNWVVNIQSALPPKVVNSDGSAYLLEPVVKRGYYVQVLVNIDGNASTQNPGIYVNFSLVSYQGPGVEISSGPDPKTVGFGQGPKPAGILPAPAGMASVPVVAPVPASAVAPPPPAAITPAPAFLAPAALPAGPVMTAKANGAPLEAFLANGWTLDTLRANGYIV